MDGSVDAMIARMRDAGVSHRVSTSKTDIARRVFNHTFKLDPIVRSLLDTDFYKLLMLQMIWGLYRDVDATFSLDNRTHERAAGR